MCHTEKEGIRADPPRRHRSHRAGDARNVYGRIADVSEREADQRDQRFHAGCVDSGRDSARQLPDRPETDGWTVRRNCGQSFRLSAGDPGGHAGGDSVDPPRVCGPDDRRGGGLLGRVCAVGKRYAQTGGFTGLHHLGDDCRGGGHAGFQSAVPPAVETAA